MMKFSRAISRVKWLSGEKKPTFRRPYLPCHDKNPEDEDRDGLRNVGFFTAQSFDPADSPRKLHHTQSPGKQQISIFRDVYHRLITQQRE
jgi:hypothetical protein